MGDFNQLLYFQKHVPKKVRSVLEVGSRDYGNTQPFRKCMEAERYVGVDLEPGTNVDVVGDLSEGLCGLAPGFDVVLCCSVLEHCRKPWKLAENILALLAAPGLLYVSVPWIQRYHPYPEDYWRFSPRGIEELFPGLQWNRKRFSTTHSGDFVTGLDADQRLSTKIGKRKLLPHLILHMIGVRHG